MATTTEEHLVIPTPSNKLVAIVPIMGKLLVVRHTCSSI